MVKAINHNVGGLIMDNKTAFISVAEIQKVLDVSESKAYRIVRSLNSELKKEGFLVLPGKVC